jgi:U3 small nucleolar RNA-associated protein 24
MGKTKKTKKFALVKRRISQNDDRLKKNEGKAAAGGKKKNKVVTKRVEQVPSALFFKFNTQLGPPYRVIVDTNFINFSIKNKLDPFTAMMDCLLAKCIPCITDCVIAELEKLGGKFRMALRIAKDPRFERLICTHSGTYADDCLCERVRQHRCYVVATCDKDLRRRLRKVSALAYPHLSRASSRVESWHEIFSPSLSSCQFALFRIVCSVQ